MKIRNYWQQPRCSKNNRITGGHHPKHRVCSAACSQVLLQNQLIFYCIATRLMWLLTIYLFILLFPLIILNQVMTESKKERRVWYDDLSTIAILSIAYAVSSSLMFVVTLRSSCGHIVLIIMSVVAIVMIVVGCKCCPDCYCCQTKCQYAGDTYCKKPVLNGVFHFFF
jgi:hypothetical protein